MRADRERRRKGERQSGRSGPLGRFRGSRRTFWIIAAAVFLLIWVISGLLLRGLSSGEILDGTSVNGVDLGGKSRQEATKLIDGFEPQKIDLLGPQRTITVRAPQAGLVVDAGSSAERAYSAGRSGVVAVLQGPLTPFLDRELEPVYGPVDSKRLKRTVDRIADRLDRDPFVGALAIDPASLEVTTKQPKAGVRVRRGATRTNLLDAFRDGRESMEIPVRKRPAPSQAEVEVVAGQAEDYLRHPLRISISGRAAKFTPGQIARVLTIESAGDGPDDGIELTADAGKLENLVAKFAAPRDRKARDASIDAPPQPPVALSEQGDLSWSPTPDAAEVSKGRTGRRILQEEAVKSAIEAVRTGSHQVTFTSEPVEPKVTTNMVRNATALLGTFTTSYSCCEPRVTNIQQMAKTVDETVIGPGEQFSLNGIAGERTEANGYKPAPTIGEDNELIDTVGGGVSQFSTTTYNAAYFAGLQIDSHTPHSFYIDRYPPGREATLNFGSIDLLWTNDTKAPVVVRSSASDTSVTVSIYGDNGDRRVRAETQSRSDNSLGGFDITIDRVIVDEDGTRSREPFTTTYGVPGG